MSGPIGIARPQMDVGSHERGNTPERRREGGLHPWTHSLSTPSPYRSIKWGSEVWREEYGAFLDTMVDSYLELVVEGWMVILRWQSGEGTKEITMIALPRSTRSSIYWRTLAGNGTTP